MSRSFRDLCTEAQKELGLSYPALARLTGAGQRTLERNYGVTQPRHARILVIELFKRGKRELAEDLALASGTTLEALGLIPRGSTPIPSAPVMSAAEAAATVVETAVQVSGIPVEILRPAISAAFLKAVSLGVSAKDVAEALAKPGDAE